jgi:hypothetical protein
LAAITFVVILAGLRANAARVCKLSSLPSTFAVNHGHGENGGSVWSRSVIGLSVRFSKKTVMRTVEPSCLDSRRRASLGFSWADALSVKVAIASTTLKIRMATLQSRRLRLCDREATCER